MDQTYPEVGRKSPLASVRLAQFPGSYHSDIVHPLVFVLRNSFYFTIKSHEKEDAYAEEGISQVKHRPKGECYEVDDESPEDTVVKVSECASQYKSRYEQRYIFVHIQIFVGKNWNCYNKCNVKNY